MSYIGPIEYYYTASGLIRYQVEVSHEELNQYQVIKGDDETVVSLKARVKAQQWDKRWEKKLEIEHTREERRKKAVHAEERANLALVLTKEALELNKSIEEVLHHTLSINDAIDWSSLIDRSEFSHARPVEPSFPIKPVMRKKPRVPLRQDTKYAPKFGLWDKISSASRSKKVKEAQERFESDYSRVISQCTKIETDFKEALAKWNNACENLKANYHSQLETWSKEREKFYSEQSESNKAIGKKKDKYFNRDVFALSEYVDTVLSNSSYPDCFSPYWDLHYNQENKIIVVDYGLPSPDSLPKLKEVKYIKTRDELVEKYFSQAYLNRQYDSIVYKIALRTIHEIFESDVVEMISAVTFNGFVNSIDRSTGHETNSCVISVQANKDEFLGINLSAVDPKACFKKLKGVGSSKLYSVTPVAPIIRIEKNDNRFVESYDVVDTLEEGENLAAMDWEDFEHLIRELFEKEFTEAGAEVKVTQASKDGGIDAVIFDPDPIKGGKIVVQAKRYTNVVGVSAVRDLYGTLMNEGANKGILVTTSNFGPDAYEFSKGKPIALLDGGNLLHLLEKHGYKAKVDLKEAKKILAEENNN